MTGHAHAVTPTCSTGECAWNAEEERDLLDEVAHLLAKVHEGTLTRTVVASIVALLETTANASLGPVQHDSMVLLTRRFARAHARANASARLPTDSAQSLQAYRDVLRETATAQRPNNVTG